MNTSQQHPAAKHRKRRTWKIVLISIVAILILFRLFLPYIVLKFVNKKLAGLEEYYGHVKDIDIAIIRGAYQINDIVIQKVNKETRERDSIPFFKSPKIDLSVQWNAIFKGAIVGEIHVEEPIVNFVKGKHKNEDVKADTADFKDVIRDLMPLTINHFEIHNGQIHYIDKYSAPAIDIAMKNIQVMADNLSNVNDSNQVLPAGLKASGEAYDGTFDLNVKFNALEKQPTFDMNANLKHVNMVKLNSFFQAYANFDVKKGSLGLYTEFAAKDGAFKGYVKPIIKDFEVNKEEGTFKERVWENIVQGVAKILENPKKDQVATKLPIEGRFDQPDTGLWTAINYVLRNAFVFALRPSVDNTINIGAVEEPKDEKKTFLQKVFGKKDKDKKEDKEEKKE